MKSPNHIIVTGCIGPFYNEKLFINNNLTQKGSFCSRFFWPWNKFNAWLVLKWEQLLPSPVQILQGGVKHVLQMTSHGNICSLLSLQLEFTSDHEPLSIHPASSQSVPASSLSWSKHFSPAWEFSPTWCLQGAQTHLAQAVDHQKLPTHLQYPADAADKS